MIGNETGLHYKVVDLMRKYYPDSILVAGLGENQDTDDKRLDLYKLTPASQVEVGCPWARGLQPQYTPRRKNTHRPTNPQPSHEPPRAKPKGPPGRKPGARGLGAAEPQAPRAQT